MPEKNLIVHPGYTSEQIQLIKDTIAVGATDDELKLFLYTANKHKLDPLIRQIHFVKRGGKMTIQTGIDGYRAIANRTGDLAGIDDAIYDSEAGKAPKKATVTVYRLIKGNRIPFTATARWSEYAPPGDQGFMWLKMPYLMLAKCAEALALRKAFPDDLAGIYTDEEMAQANLSKVETPVKTEPVEHEVKQLSPSDLLRKEIANNLQALTGYKLKSAKDFCDRCLDLTGLVLEPKNFEQINEELLSKLKLDSSDLVIEDVELVGVTEEVKTEEPADVEEIMGENLIENPASPVQKAVICELIQTKFKVKKTDKDAVNSKLLELTGKSLDSLTSDDVKSLNKKLML